MTAASLLLLGIQPDMQAHASSEARVAYTVPLPASFDQPYAVKIRSEMGLNSEVGHILSVATRSDSTGDVMGTPLTPAESADIEGRQVLNKWADTVESVVTGEPSYAGMWIDQKAGGVLHIAIAGPHGESTYTNLRKLLPVGDRVVFDHANYTLTALRAAHAAVTADLVARKPLFKYVRESAVSIRANRVSLTIDGKMPAAEQNELSKSYGPTVALRTSSQGYVAQSTRDMPIGRVYAGAWLSSPLSECTVGYGATQNAEGDLYAATAGHCRGTNFRQGHYYNGTSLGQSHQNHYLDGSGNCDCQVIGPMAPSGQAGRDLLIDNNGLYNLTHTGGKSEQRPGTYVCHSGALSYDTNGGHIVCGNVVDDEVTIPYLPDEFGQRFTLTDATTTTIVVTRGDSGGPLNAGSALLGILGAYNEGLRQSAFSKVYNVAARTNVTFLY